MMKSSGGATHILIVEDDADLRDSLAAYLKMQGFHVTVAGTCRECYMVLNDFPFSIAILDVSLPDQSGFVLAEYLRGNTGMKIIMLTALERLEDRIRGYSSGAHNYFVKPVDTAELLAAINSLAEGAETAAGTSRPLVSAETWYLKRKTWQLQSPQGTLIKLTSLELRMLEMFAAAPDGLVSRNILLEGIYKRCDEHSSRALDSLVRRLRAKISSNCINSPIKTAHAVGFCFSSHISMI